MHHCKFRVWGQGYFNFGLCKFYGNLNFVYGVYQAVRNRPFSCSENERGSNDISLQFVEVSNVHDCDRSSNDTLSNLEPRTL